MRIEFLGTGGAIPTPRPGCHCRVCEPARRYGVPHARMGPSLFVHGPDVLIDTPEESRLQLNRAGIDHVTAVLYSHWHPDHTMGRRVWETMNMDWRGWPQAPKTVQVYLPEQVAKDFEERLGLGEHFAFMRSHGTVDIHVIPEGESITVGDVRITPIPLAESYVYAFLFEEGNTRVLIAMDELFGWTPPAELTGVDLAILPTGVFEFDFFTGERRIPKEHPVLASEATFRQTLEMVRALRPRRLIFTHIEEPDGNTVEDLERIAHALWQREGWDISFAYDTMMVSDIDGRH
ncbi:MAG: hypothetical protein GXO55_05325 [Chloroflexi bacterium]|nr:hypothetical protein [Chloroflexota bacterium]